MNQGQEGSQDHLALLVKKVFPDSKDQLVYLVSLYAIFLFMTAFTLLFLLSYLSLRMCVRECVCVYVSVFQRAFVLIIG